MNLKELMSPWIKDKVPDLEITGLHNDSRQITPGSLFIAYPGNQVDGRLYIADAIKAGTVAVIYEPESYSHEFPKQVPCIPLSDLSTKLAQIASRFYGDPSRQLDVIGITGTNGKTTIAYQLAQGMDLLGTPSAYVGTLGHGQVDQLGFLNNTTPDALCLQELLSQYNSQAIKSVCIEVSSHALCQHRVDEIDFRQAIFTNLSHEHLDYHQSMEAYAAAKMQLFAYPSLRQAIINGDDDYSDQMKKSVKSIDCELISYGITEKQDVRALNWTTDLSGSHFEVQSPWGKANLTINALGFFNIYNILAIFSSLLSMNYSLKQVVPVLSKLKGAPGRMEILHQNPSVIVDYSHTPDALKSALMTLQQLKKKRLFVVFGCGGNRDKTKRPLMGKIAADNSDFVILTNDNPRKEDPMSILHEIEQGMANSQTPYYKILDRKEAISRAVSLLEKDDILLIAGKGHEDYQQIGDIRYPFSDQEVVRNLLKKTVSSLMNGRG